MLIFIGLILAFIVLIVIIAIVANIITSVNNQSTYEDELKKYLNSHNISFTMEKAKHSAYSFVLSIEDTKYLIKMIHLPTDADLQINSKTTWEVKYGAGKNPGRAHPHSSYLGSNIDVFMNLHTNENEKKIVVVVPKPRKIVMYINESEIVFVTPSTNVHGTKIIASDDFSVFK